MQQRTSLINLRTKVASLFLVGAMLYMGTLWIRSLVTTRESTRLLAERELLSSRPKAQVLQGLFLSYQYSQEIPDETGQQSAKLEQRYSAPETLAVQGELNVRPLTRGIFSFPSNSTQWKLRAKFAAPVQPSQGQGTVTQLVRRQLLVLASPSNALQSKLQARVGGKTLSFKPDRSQGLPGAYAALLPDEVSAEDLQDVEVSLVLTSLNSSSLKAVAAEVSLELSSPWQHPSFQGLLPEVRTVTGKGFSARWQRSEPQVNSEQPMRLAELLSLLESSPAMETVLLPPIETYRKIFRALEYSLLFIGLLFGACILCELLADLRVHPAQYFLVGAALILFYLSLLSLSEHLPFIVAYLLAASVAVWMVAGYMKAAFGGRYGLLFGGALSAVYLYLYFVLAAEDYALLSGSTALLALLAACMYATRKLDWYALCNPTPRGSDSARVVPPPAEV